MVSSRKNVDVVKGNLTKSVIVCVASDGSATKKEWTEGFYDINEKDPDMIMIENEIMRRMAFENMSKEEKAMKDEARKRDREERMNQIWADKIARDKIAVRGDSLH